MATTSEPSVLLPFLYTLREEGARAEYWHVTVVQAIEDFCRELPRGRADYLASLRALALDLYGKAAGDGPVYFLDKTPRYHLVAHDVMRLFPDGKFIFLWRNPLSVLASLIETFRGGRWEPYHFHTDLFEGAANLVHAWQGAAGNACAVRFEDLVGGDGEWRRLFAYLELRFDPDLLARFADVALKGRYGDPTGVRRYAHLSAEPLDKWKETVDSPVRGEWCRRYLRALGAERLAAMGYDLDAALRELDALPVDGGHPAADLLRATTSRVAQRRRARALRLPEGPQPIGAAFAGRPSVGVRLATHARRALRQAIDARSG